MRFHPSFLPAVLLAASAVTSACDVRVGENGVSLDIAEGKATEEWVRTYTVSPGGSLEIRNINGPIEVQAAEGQQIEVRAERVARAASDEQARQRLAASRMSEDVTPEAVRIATVNPPEGSFRLASLTVSYLVRVPAGLTVSVVTENGRVAIEGVTGTMQARTTNGGIRVSNVSGALKADVVNGGIELDMSGVTGAIEAETVNGGIRMTLPPDVGAQLDARAVNGGVSVDDALRLASTEQHRGRIAGTLNAGGPSISARTVNGGVRIGARANESAQSERRGR